MENMPKVSILVPVYKVQAFIEKCARSLFEQSYTNIEYIFVDDCTPDNSIEILKTVLKDYPERKESVSIFRNEVNLGISKVRNILLSHATGEYIYFVDSDDYVDIHAIDSFVKAALLYRAEIVFCNYYRNDLSEKHIIKQKKAHDKDELLTLFLSNTSNNFDGMWKLFIKRSLIDKYHLRFSTEVNVCEDYIMSFKLFYYVSSFFYLDKALYYYTCVGNPNSYTASFSKSIGDVVKAIEIVQDFMMEQKIECKYVKLLLHKKFACKCNYLINKKLYDLKKYATIFPEANKVWRMSEYHWRLKEKIKFWLAEKNCYGIINMMYKISKL